ncbi:uncharacterized protein LOC120130969 [Hibiscus syriacus]|uniref:uncharacterized protein LOC120130969 n=1 Tax=Hibiscus syriacus TaxID=106335 RepID=UPI001924815A|nr:uncharacterized protein LOC120130969 [Hibiscus syriacus]
MEVGIAEWKLSLVGQFLGPAPNFATMQRIVDNLWAKASHSSRIQVSLASSNLYIFSFATESARDWVLENGPWHIINKPLILRKWEPSLKRLNFDLSKIPIWVHLYNVPLELFSQAGLSYLASGVGIPISMDSVTTSKTMLEFAKVCVEIGVNDEIPKSIDVMLQDGQTSSVFVEIPWLPPRCKKCLIFGHNDKNCLAKLLLLQPLTKFGKKKEISCSTSTQIEMENVQAHDNLNAQSKETPQASNHLTDPQCSEIYVLPLDNNLPSSVTSDKSNSIDVGHSSVILTDLPVNTYDANQSFSNDPHLSKDDGSSVPKRGRGRPHKEKNGFTGSRNRFDLLNTIDEASPIQEVPQRKNRIASMGVAELVKDLKQKKRDKLDKVKSIKVGGEGTTLELNPQ